MKSQPDLSVFNDRDEGAAAATVHDNPYSVIHNSDADAIAKGSIGSDRQSQNTNELTAYERFRAQNIERNQTRLADLGLVSRTEAKKAIDAAWKKPPPSIPVLQEKKKTDSNAILNKSTSARTTSIIRTRGFKRADVSRKRLKYPTDAFTSSAQQRHVNDENRKLEDAETTTRVGKWVIPTKGSIEV